MKKTLRSDTIKIIAMVLMAIDHIGCGIIEPLYLTATDYSKSVVIYRYNQVFRGLGRIAFPIFCYQLVEGFFYTKNRAKYIRNILLFALISEIPFDLLDKGQIISFGYQNVMFTLLIGILMLCTLEWIKKTDIVGRISKEWLGKTLYMLLIAAVVIAFSVVCYYIKSDYGAKGIVLIAVLYFLHNDKTSLIQFGPILFIIDIFVVTLITSRNLHATVNYSQFEALAIGAFLLMYLDNGERHGGKTLKWIGYWFYPLHQLVIYLISLVMFK